VVGALAAMPACTDEAPAAWSALATCMAGDAVRAGPAERARQLHLLELGDVGATGPAEARWPARCTRYANQLFEALSSSGASAVLYRTMQRQLGCTETKGSCRFPKDSSVLVFAPELWDGAQQAGFENKVAANVPAPKVSVKVLLSAAEWHGFMPNGGQIVSPTIAADGRVTLLLKQGGGRVKPVGCEFKAGLQSVECVTANDKVPNFPAQSLELVADDRALIVSGLTEDGRLAYDLRTGESAPARGLTGQMRRDGLVVERGEEDKGYVVIDLRQRPKPVEVELPTTEVVLAPVSLGSRIAWVEKNGTGALELVIQGMKGRKLGEARRTTGPFSGAFHVCRRGDFAAIATWAPHAGQRGGTPTSGSDKTQVAVTLLDGDKASPLGLATIPFDRVAESELVCSDAGSSLAWVREADAGIEVGRTDCTSAGCKADQVRVPGVVAKWWWAVAPIGDKVAVLWRDALGATRLRVAALPALASTPDTLAFDAPDQGGPEVGEATVLETGDALLLLFKGEKPVAMRVGGDGALKLL
jgi:hypothetical protein